MRRLIGSKISCLPVAFCNAVFKGSVVVVYCETLNIILLFSNIFLIIYGFSRRCILITHLLLTIFTVVQVLMLGFYTVIRTRNRPEVHNVFAIFALFSKYLFVYICFCECF
jgi:hypothetical protein